MAFPPWVPEIVYAPVHAGSGSGPFTLNFPFIPDFVDVQRLGDRATEDVSAGNVVIVAHEDFVDFIHITMEFGKVEGQGFADEFEAFAAWAGIGGHFALILNRVDAVGGVTDAVIPLAATSISLDPDPSVLLHDPKFDGITPYILASDTEWEPVTFTSAGLGPGDYTIGGLYTETVNTYPIGSTLRNAFWMPNAVLVNRGTAPLQLVNRTTYRLEMACQSTMGDFSAFGPPVA